MKTSKNIILALITVISIIACNQKQETEKFIISGQVTGFPDGTKFYLKNLATDAVFDSTVIDNGAFKFEGSLVSPPEQIWLNTTVDRKFVYTNLLIGNDNITIKGDISDFPWNVNIKGSKPKKILIILKALQKKII